MLSQHSFSFILWEQTYFQGPFVLPKNNVVEPWVPTGFEGERYLKQFRNSIKDKMKSLIYSGNIKFPKIDVLITKTLRKFQHDKNLVIKPADKNLGLVLMDKQYYIDICMVHLLDINTYCYIDQPKYVNKRIFANLRRILHQHNRYYDNMLSNNKKPVVSKLAISLLQFENSKKCRFAPFYCLPNNP